MGNININTKNDTALGIDKLSEVCDVFCLDNLIKDTTCDTIYGSSSIDAILTNRKESFMKNSTVNISDCHKIVLTVLRAHYERLKPLKIQYRSYKNINGKDFLRDQGSMPFHRCNQMHDKENAYNCFKQCSQL